ncbi:hypothetical protein PY365_24955 [Roseiarcaceae bacterium H3SJ34-1]|uniref:hypothetical protein n=1 Tax=Terripilifer ovatus TaxID=3032367 RepID=UPI003AB9878E|nr:hypothetical protein [Roseiarcaceae bacterium H3SJ34-1]
MAQLSDADKKLLLGENYKEAEKAADLANTKTAQQRVAETLRANCERVRSSALVLSGIAAIIAVTNYMQVSGPYQRPLGIAATSVVLAGIVCASFAQITLYKNS